MLTLRSNVGASLSSRGLIKFVIGVLVAGGLTHAVTAMSVTAAIEWRYADRIFDIRNWPGSPTDGFRLIGTYLRERLSKLDPPVTMFAGSSVTYGYPWSRSQIFSRRYSEARQTPVVNASVLALDVSGINDWIVCAAVRNKLRVATLIIEVPVINTVAQLAAHHRSSTPAPPMSDCVGIPDPGYAWLAWSRPLGLGWFVFLWDRDATEKPDAVMNLAAVPVGYFTGAADFDAVAPLFDTQIATLIANARTVADRVYLFPSPVFIGGLEQIGEDAASVRAQIARAMTACVQAGGVRCLDASFLGERQDHFTNFTHLNQAGHRALAEWLATQVH